MRPYSALPTFDAAEAGLDRIEFSVEVRLRYRSRDEIDEYLGHIGDRSIGPPLLLVERDQSDHTKTLRVASGWHLAGKDKISNLAASDGGTARLSLTLAINPTRFIGLQAPDAQPDAVELLPASVALAVDENRAREASASSLDASTNILLGASRMGGTGFERRREWWNRWEGVYLRHLDALLHEWLVPSPTNALPRLEARFEMHAPRQGEVWWELEHMDPIGAVLSLADRVQTVAGNNLLRHHFVDLERVSSGTKRNGATLRVELSRGSGKVLLVAYAKGSDRVRCEVRYLDRFKDRVARALPARNDVDTVLAVLDAARDDAATKIVRLFTAIAATATGATPDRNDLFRLLQGLLEATDHNIELARQIMSPLVQVGGIFETADGGIAPRALCDRLVRLGIIRRSMARHGGPRRYVLRGQFYALVTAMLEALPARALRKTPQADEPDP